MPQLTPFLKPPAVVPPGDDAPAERDALNLPRLGASGLWIRVGAFAFDFVLLWMAGYLVGKAFHDSLMNHGDAAWLLGGLATLLYFAVAFGPVGGGRTVGMLLVGIRVVGLDGGVPGVASGFIRAAVLLPGLLTSRLLVPWLGGDTFVEVHLGLLLTVGLTFAMVTAQLLAIVFNPFKMGLHDFAAQTMVRPDAADLATFEELKERIGPMWRRYYLQPQVTGAATFTIVFGFVLFANWPTRLSEAARERFAAERALMATAGIDGGELVESGFNPPAMPAADPQASEATPAPLSYDKMFAYLTDDKTTAPLIFHLGIDHRGRIEADAVQLEERGRRYAEAYHRGIFGRYDADDIFPGANLSTKALRRRPIEFEIVFYESLILMMPVSRQELARFTISMPPLEPALAGSGS